VHKIILWIFLFFLVLAIGGCNPFKSDFERNPDLRLLLKKENTSFFNAIWTSNGNIFYLSAISLSGCTDYAKGGELRCVGIDGSNDRLVLSGKFCSLAISPIDGMLALSYEEDISSMRFDGGQLIIVDTTGSILDTLPTTLPRIVDIEFSADGSRLFYYAYSTDSTLSDSFGFYSIGIDGTNEELLEAESDYRYFASVGFDLNENDAIFHSSQGGDYIVRPQFYPLDYNFMLYVKGGDPAGPSELIVFNHSSNAYDTLDADPYHSVQDYSGILWGSWAPSGDKIVLSVGVIHGEVFFIGDLELWILEDVWE
jgi:hypothetical protein